MEEISDWHIGLFSVGDPAICCYSTCCLCCATASAKSNVDDSECITNCCCFNLLPVRWLIRSAYDIPGSGTEDIIASLLCPCCTVNQMLQTSAHRGNPQLGTGREYQHGDWKATHCNSCYYAGTCLFSTVCIPCSIGSSLHKSLGMPFVIGCCCVNPCAARSLIRYQYNISGRDVADECLYPCCSSMALAVTSALLNPLYCLLALPFLGAITTQVAAESKLRRTRNRSRLRYLFNGRSDDIVVKSASGEAYPGGSPVPALAVPYQQADSSSRSLMDMDAQASNHGLHWGSPASSDGIMWGLLHVDGPGRGGGGGDSALETSDDDYALPGLSTMQTILGAKKASGLGELLDGRRGLSGGLAPLRPGQAMHLNLAAYYDSDDDASEEQHEGDSLIKKAAARGLRGGGAEGGGVDGDDETHRPLQSRIRQWVDTSGVSAFWQAPSPTISTATFTSPMRLASPVMKAGLHAASSARGGEGNGGEGTDAQEEYGLFNMN